MRTRRARSDGRSLMTIGYEGLDLPRFLRFLTSNKVEVLVDVREVAASRKKGFAKTALSQALAETGIDYTHMRALGSPSKIRKKLKTDWDYAFFFRAYDEYLDGQGEALAELQDLVATHQRVCLMCFESDHERCHRSHVADRLAQTLPEQVAIEPVNTYV